MNKVGPRSTYGRDSSLTRLAQMSYDEQSDKLAGTIGLLKQWGPFTLTMDGRPR